MNKLGSYQEIVEAVEAELRRAKVHAAACRDTLAALKKREMATAATPPDEDAAISAGVAVMVGMMVAGYSTPEMVRAARGKPCPYCREVMQSHGDRRASRDHLWPRVNGGKLTRGNVLIVCQTCNGDKGTRTLTQWLFFLRRDGDQRAAIVAALIDEIKRLDGRVV